MRYDIRCVWRLFVFSWWSCEWVNMNAQWCVSGRRWCSESTWAVFSLSLSLTRVCDLPWSKGGCSEARLLKALLFSLGFLDSLVPRLLPFRSQLPFGEKPKSQRGHREGLQGPGLAELPVLLGNHLGWCSPANPSLPNTSAYTTQSRRTIHSNHRITGNDEWMF